MAKIEMVLISIAELESKWIATELRRKTFFQADLH